MRPNVLRFSLYWRTIGVPLLFIYCLTSAMPGLWSAWQNAPYEHHSEILFLIWLTPLVGDLWYALARDNSDIAITTPLLPMCIVGAIVSFLGNIAEVNLLNHFGLAILCSGIACSFHPREQHIQYTTVLVRWIWAVAAVWMPIFGWLSAHFGLGPDDSFVLRLTILLVFGGISWIPLSFVHPLYQKPRLITSQNNGQEERL